MTTKRTEKENLVGKFFLTFDYEHGNKDLGYNLQWQGIVIGNPEPGWYLVQLFEWISGGDSCCRLVRIEDMARWLFFRHNDQMLEVGRVEMQRAEQREMNKPA